LYRIFFVLNNIFLERAKQHLSLACPEPGRPSFCHFENQNGLVGPKEAANNNNPTASTTKTSLERRSGEKARRR
jgi:hypothetical protein